jgi:YidC/Oxa1 family membrane protein insertase
MNARLIIALLITVIMIFVYQYLFAPKPLRETPQTTEIVKTEQEERVEPKAESPQVPMEQQRPKEGVVYQDVVVDTPLYTATFSTYGGRLKSWKLKEYMDKVPMHPLGKFVQNTVGGILGKKGVDETPPQPVDIVNTRALEDLPLGIKFSKGGIEYDEGIPFVLSSAGVTLTHKGEEKNLILRWRSPEGMQIDKRFTFYADTYQMDMEIVVSNPSSRASGEDTLELGWIAEVQQKERKYGFVGPVYFADGDYKKIKPKKLNTEEKIVAAIDWFGVDQDYFIALVYPTMKETELSLRRTSEDFLHSTLSTSLGWGSENKGGVSYTLFLGPKITDLLSQITPTAKEITTYGWLNLLAVGVLKILRFTHNVTGNYGLDIIILAIFLKIIFTPLTHKSQQSMKEMQKLQPEVKKLQQKYKEDKQALNREIMELYKRRKVNPLGGCLPLLLQMPVFFALYRAFLNAIELRHSPFIFWIRDLSDKDPTYITPLLMGATMFLQQKMTTVSADPAQAKMMALMPIFFIFIFLGFPSGLVLYWLVTNVLAIGHQMYINRKP